MNGQELVKESAWERHGQTILASLVLCGIVWMANAVQGLREAQIATNGELKISNAKIEALSNSVHANDADRYTSRQALSDLALRDERIERNAARIEALEREVMNRGNPRSR